jgi:hypothetical protein
VAARGVWGEYRQQYLDLAGDRRVEDAVELCLDLLEGGARAEDITLRLLRPAQQEVGHRWAVGTWAVAQEHAASAVTDAALAALSAAVPARSTGQPVVVACPEGEWHGLAGRMVTALLRWRGIAADYAGTLASGEAVAELLTGGRARALALSCTTTSALPGVASAAAVAADQGAAVLAGGEGFGPGGRYAPAVGLTAWDPCVREAAQRLARWEVTGRTDGCRPVPEPIGYRRLVRCRRRLTEDLADALAVPGLGTEHADTLRDAADQVVGLALATAYTGHSSILREGMRELAAVLAARPDGLAAVAARLPQAASSALARHRVRPPA